MNYSKEWKKRNTITVTVYCPVCQLPNKYIVKLPPEVVDEILYIGFTDGIKHWCEKTESLNDNSLGVYNSDQISRDGSVILYDRNGTGKYLLDIEAFLSGFYLAFARHLALSLYKDGKEDFLKITSQTCDEIIQYAVFGEVKYTHEKNNEEV